MREVKVAFVAPGQGTDSWEDGKRLIEEAPDIVEPVYHRIRKATGVDIVARATRNDTELPTEIAQPMSVGIGFAQSEVLIDRGISPDYVIGLSAGEFTVAAITRSMTLENAAKISRARGVSQDRELGGKGGVVLAIHKEPLNFVKLKEKVKNCYPSNFHNPIMTGIAYYNDHKDELLEELRSQGAKLREVKSLNFLPHGEGLKITREMLQKRLSKSRVVRTANTDWISIRNGKVIRSPSEIIESLVWQTTEPTRLDLAMETAISQGVEEVYALPPGKTIPFLLGYYANAGTIRLMPLTETVE